MKVNLKYVTISLFLALLSMGNLPSFAMELLEEKEFEFIEPEGPPVEQIFIENNSFFPLSLSFIKKGDKEETTIYLPMDLGTEPHGPRIVLNKEEIVGPVVIVSIAKPEPIKDLAEWTNWISRNFPSLAGKLTNWANILQRIPFISFMTVATKKFPIDLKDHGPVLHIFWPLLLVLKGSDPLFIDLAPRTFLGNLWYRSRRSLVQLMSTTKKGAETSLHVVHDWFKEKTRKPKPGQTVDEIFRDEIEPHIRIFKPWPPEIIEEYP